MSELNERDILRRMRELSAVRPAADDIARAIRAARWAMLRRKIMKTGLIGSLAASIVVGVFLAVVSFSGDEAAAKVLLAVAQATEDYHGWVHERSSHRRVEGTGVVHYNTETGVWAWAGEDAEGVKRATLYLPAQKLEYAYDGMRNEINISDISQELVDWKKHETDPKRLTVTNALARLREDVQGAKVTETTENGLLRFEVIITKEDAQRAGKAEAAKHLPAKLIWWANAKTKLLTKIQGESPDGRYVLERTYGEPAIRDIYDLGVPRDAKVIDNRLTPNANELVDRLQRRYEKGYGDFVAIAAGPYDGLYEDLTLYARRGNAVLSHRYLVGAKRYKNTGNSRDLAIDVPANWPKPKLDDLLPALQETLPANFMVVNDDGQAWSGDGACRAEWKSREIPSRIDSKMIGVMSVNLCSKIWPTPQQLGLNSPIGPRPKVELLRDSARPGLIGLNVRRQVMAGISERQMQSAVEEELLWLDPARDDMPIERHNKRLEEEKVVSSFDVTYLEYAQLPGGQWYPARWRTKMMQDQGGKVYEDEYETVLQIWPGRTLDATWFDDPAKRAAPPQ